jgi:small subunit ribosomal protein S16
MLKIKLSRTGKKHEPHFRFVVIEARDKRDGRYVENLGHYNPISKEFVLDVLKYEDWLKKGAQPTETVASLVLKHAVKKA